MDVSGLIILKEPLDLILSGEKTWELRGKVCHKRGLIGLIESKSGTVVGTTELVDCVGPLSVADINKNLKKLGVSKNLKSLDQLRYETPYAWVLQNAKRFKKPIPYKHKSGVVVWHPVTI